jgi:uncharacterized protein
LGEGRLSGPLSHLKYANLPHDAQRAAFLDIIWADPLVRTVLERARDFDLPDWWLVSGVLYNSVWNHLTGKPSGYGVNDADLFYFDDSDISYEAEDAVIRRGADIFKGVSLPVEIRNQARVHLWYEQRFGGTYPPLMHGSDGLASFASKTHAAGVRLEPDGKFIVCAPFGLNDIFSFRLTPNRALDNRATHHAKAARQIKLWPELELVPW